MPYNVILHMGMVYARACSILLWLELHNFDPVSAFKV